MTVTDAATNNHDLVVRVRKLLDKAEGTANPHEADAFSRKAAELIATHCIDPDYLAAVDASDSLALIEVDIGRGAYVRARLALLMAVAKPHDARVVFETRPTGTVALVAGFRSDLDVVEMMYTSLHQQAATQMAQQRRGTAAATQRFRRSFLFGFANRIGEVLDSPGTQGHSNSQPTGGQSQRALIMQSREQRLDDYAAAQFGPVRSARAPRAAQAAGWGAGSDAAGRADVGRSRLTGRGAIGRGRS